MRPVTYIKRSRLAPGSWLLNRLLQSMGWPGAVKLTSRWFSFSTYGTAMGLISQSYLFGDAASRQLMGWLIGRGVGWRGVFLAAAGVMLAIFIVLWILLKESPRDIGEAEPTANPRSLVGGDARTAEPVPLKSLLRILLRSPAFLMVCALSLGCTLLRETFNTWTPTYFTQAVGLTKAEAASRSALFPLFGGLSVLLAGFVSDELGRAGRAVIILVGVLLCGLCLLALGNLDFGSSPTIPVWLVSAVAFTLIGPYAYLGGALALDFGGKQGSATAAGIIDGVGYLGGVLAGADLGRLTVGRARSTRWPPWRSFPAWRRQSSWSIKGRGSSRTANVRRRNRQPDDLRDRGAELSCERPRVVRKPVALARGPRRPAVSGLPDDEHDDRARPFRPPHPQAHEGALRARRADVRGSARPRAGTGGPPPSGG